MQEHLTDGIGHHTEHLDDYEAAASDDSLETRDLTAHEQAAVAGGPVIMGK